jgi:hypothetical protein
MVIAKFVSIHEAFFAIEIALFCQVLHVIVHTHVLRLVIFFLFIFHVLFPYLLVSVIDVCFGLLQFLLSLFLLCYPLSLRQLQVDGLEGFGLSRNFPRNAQFIFVEKFISV